MTMDVHDPEEPLEVEVVKVPPIQNRFLFVDIAALRAKQLRRGARPRVGVHIEAKPKLERIAMHEVEEGLVEYTLPAYRSPHAPPPDPEV